MVKAKIAVIGGSGTYNVEGAKEIETVNMETPFGKPSDAIKIVEIQGKNVAFLPRHGVGHRLLPTEIPVRANIWALKNLGVEWIFTVSAVGSLREEIEPRHFIIPNQVIDRTKNRVNSFFGNGIVGHVPFADPFCEELNAIIEKSIREKSNIKTHTNKTYLCMEGPLFSTKAESNMYRAWGADIIGMTALPEAKLAREAGMSYSCIAMSTDYDCWHPEHDSVTLEMIIGHMSANTKNAQQILPEIIKNIPDDKSSPYKHVAKTAIITDRKLIPAEVKKKLELLFGEYL